MKRSGQATAFECGIDIVDRRKFSEILARHGRRFAKRVFTDAELANLAAQRDDAAYPLGFAFKEAVWKALPEDAQRRNFFREIRILWRNGKPLLSIARYRGKFLLDWSVTTTSVIAIAIRIDTPRWQPTQSSRLEHRRQADGLYNGPAGDTAPLTVRTKTG